MFHSNPGVYALWSVWQSRRGKHRGIRGHLVLQQSWSPSLSAAALGVSGLSLLRAGAWARWHVPKASKALGEHTSAGLL